jgi:hypothetical protein
VVGAVDDASRYERHEPTRTWLHRLEACGFRTLPPSPPAPDTLPGFSTTAHPGHLELAYADVPLAAVIVAVPEE